MDGITVAKNPEEPIYTEKAIELERILSTGDEEKGDNYIFTFARDVAVDSKN